MKYFIFLFFFIIFLSSLSFAQASGFSPSSFTFNLLPNEEECGTITVDSTSKISVSDKWAENKDIEWKVGLFDTSAGSHGISIDYDKELSINERQVEVCVSGSKLGEYHGVILLNEEQEGNSVIRMGIWIKLKITEKTQEEINKNAGGGGGRGGGGITTNSTTNSTNATEQIATQEGIYVSAPSTENTEETSQTTEEQNKENKNKITGLVTGKEGTRNIMIAGLFIIIITGIVIYNAQIKRKKKNGY